ncbi:MAG: DUF1801 domain-containing protein [Gammaproteobacteria bacterium]|nr:DUF1801 domain-containing protein [Gammaproteobacteria bacterium]
MAERKTNETKASVTEFINSIADETRRADCRAITRLMAKATGLKARMWGPSIIGFGKHHYQFANGKPGEICKVGFSPRARAFSFYLPKFPQHAALIKQLGKHKYSGGCLHITRLADVDTGVLQTMVELAFRTEGADAC